VITTATRLHDFCAGHRVYGHESKCAHFHGHGYRVHFTVAADKLDKIGRVLDFSVINTRLCQWVEQHWDHRFLLWEQDPLAHGFSQLDPNSVVVVPFNPTAEQMAQHLLKMVGPNVLLDTNCFLVKVVVEETHKCSAEAAL
jgi:6-pyruvoyltetrahydropterin/6-carboxytetrahydropterin synthase